MEKFESAPSAISTVRTDEARYRFDRARRGDAIGELMYNATLKMPYREQQFLVSSEPRFQPSPNLARKPYLREERFERFPSKPQCFATAQEQHADQYRRHNDETHFAFYDHVGKEEYVRCPQKFYEQPFERYAARPALSRRKQEIEVYNRQEQKFYRGEPCEHLRKQARQPEEDRVPIFYSHASVVQPKAVQDDFSRKLGGDNNHKKAVPHSPAPDRICLKKAHDQKVQKSLARDLDGRTTFLQK